MGGTGWMVFRLRQKRMTKIDEKNEETLFKIRDFEVRLMKKKRDFVVGRGTY